MTHGSDGVGAPDASGLPAPPGGVWIGISGSPESTPRSGTVHAIARCRELGIDALEMAWVQKVTLTERGAGPIRDAAARHGVRLSVHASYYINLNSPEPDKRRASIERIVEAGRAAGWAGARDVVLHLAWNHGDPPEAVSRRVEAGLQEALAHLAEIGAPVVLRLETMGRPTQFGTLDEILSLCQRLPGCAPCIDIAHLHARTGAWNTPAEFHRLWDRVSEALGAQALSDVHIHISGIAYDARNGERKHLPFAEADLDYRGFLRVLAERGVRGLVIVESPAREDDVLLLAATWREVRTEVAA